MKVCILSESPADETAICILVEAVLGEPIEPIEPRGIQGRGKGNIFASIGPVFKHLHFNSDADAFVVVVDSDDDLVHTPEHDEQGKADRKCTLCNLRGAISDAKRGLKPRQGQAELKIALGVAVPAIEAWCLLGKRSDVGEAEWAVKTKAGKYSHLKSHFKKDMYGSNRVPSLEIETKRAAEEAARIAVKLDELETRFPQGFGSLAIDIRSWQL